MKKVLKERISNLSLWPLYVFLFICLAAHSSAKAQTYSSDVVVFSASPGGIMAAIAAAKEGSSVLLIETTAHVGGIIANGGLTSSDLGNASLVGGLSRDFFQRVGDHYRATYGEKSIQLRHSIWRGIEGGAFEPKVAEIVFEKMLAEYSKIKVLRNMALNSVQHENGAIKSISLKNETGKSTVQASGKVFVDASYTGDLMAMAKVDYLLGTDSKAQFGEELAPVKATPAIQAYNYRITITNDPKNLVPIEKPANYNPDSDSYIIRLNGFLSNPSSKAFRAYWRLPNNKQDANVADWGGQNWNYPEASPAERKKIEDAHREHSMGFLYFLQNDSRLPQRIRDEVKGWGLAKDEFTDNGNFPRHIYVREARRLNGEYVMRQNDLQENRRKPDAIAVGNYPMDSHATSVTKQSNGKFNYSGGLWAPVKPYEIAYRSLVPKESESKNLLVPVCLSATHIAWTSIRMEPVFMMTGEAAGIAAALAIKNNTSVQKIPVQELQKKLINNKGIIHIAKEPIADFTWTPAKPKLGQKVKFSAKEVADANPSVKYYWDFNGDGIVDSKIAKPTTTFDFEKIHLVSLVVEDAKGEKSQPVAMSVSVGNAVAGDVQLDSEDANTTKRYLKQSMAKFPYWGKNYYTDGRTNKGRAFSSYAPTLTKAGMYAVYVSSVPEMGTSGNVPVIVEHASGTDTVWIKQQPGELFGLIHIGDFNFDTAKPAKVTISNIGTKDYVVSDMVRWVLKKESSAKTLGIKSIHKKSYIPNEDGLQIGLFAAYVHSNKIVEDFGLRPFERVQFHKWSQVEQQKGVYGWDRRFRSEQNAQKAGATVISNVNTMFTLNLNKKGMKAIPEFYEQDIRNPETRQAARKFLRAFVEEILKQVGTVALTLDYEMHWFALPRTPEVRQAYRDWFVEQAKLCRDVADSLGRGKDLKIVSIATGAYRDVEKNTGGGPPENHKPQQWLKDVFNASDIMAQDTYAPDLDYPGSATGFLQNVRFWEENYNELNKPRIITENGFSSSRDHGDVSKGYHSRGTEKEQALFYQNVFKALKNKGKPGYEYLKNIKGYSVWKYVDNAKQTMLLERHFGIKRSGGTPKPAFDVVKANIDEIENNSALAPRLLNRIQDVTSKFAEGQPIPVEYASGTQHDLLEFIIDENKDGKDKTLQLSFDAPVSLVVQFPDGKWLVKEPNVSQQLIFKTRDNKPLRVYTTSVTFPVQVQLIKAELL